MIRVTNSVHVSLAYRMGGIPLGGNWRIEGTDLSGVKEMLDHRCLFTDLPEFRDGDSGPWQVARFLGMTIHASDAETYTPTTRTLKILNLALKQNEIGLMTSREQVTQAVIETHAEFHPAEEMDEREWAKALFETLKQRVKGLVELTVDLSGGKYIVVG